MNPGPITYYPAFGSSLGAQPIAPQFLATGKQPIAESTNPVAMLCAGDHPAEPVDWLWPGRIPFGKVTLLVGDPGLGKSLIALDVAARVTRATAWPDQQSASFHPLAPAATPDSLHTLQNPDSPISALSAPGSALILSATDDLADTIRPRLDAAGADPARVFLLPSITDLRHDLDQLKAAVDRAPNCRLLILDPVNAFVGPNDSHFQIVLRRTLGPLTNLARKKRIAVLAIAHLRKTHGAAIYRAAGSMGFVAAARAVWTVCRDPHSPDRNLLLPLKHNLTAAACGLAFTTVPQPPSGAPAIAWDPTPITVPTEQALAPPPKPRAPAPERSAARTWLRETLAKGPRPAKELIDEGESRGFLRRTLRRAFHELDGHVAKHGLLKGWWWSLGDQLEARDSAKSLDLFEGDTCSPPELTPTLAESIAALDQMAQRRKRDAE
jgi:hypothetical protein